MKQMQQTLARTVTLSGIGLHSGASVQVAVHPAPADHGIVFQRADLPGKPMLPAQARYSRPTPLRTTLTTDEGVSLFTIEHLMSALVALDIDNALVSVSGPEIPLLDGSALPFYEAFAKVGVSRQSKPRQAIEILEAIEVTEGDKWARLIPDARRRFQMTIDFPHALIGQQTYRFALGEDDYLSDVAPARTFGFLKDFEALRAANLIKGGSLESAVVFDNNGVVNEEGLRFADEPARHKLLDAIGDLALVGAPIMGRYEGYKASHALNTRLAQALLDSPGGWRKTAFVSAKKDGDSRNAAQRTVFSKA